MSLHIKNFKIFPIMPMGQYKRGKKFYVYSYLGSQLNREEGSILP